MHNITALINNIWIYDKDMLGSSFGSFDGLTYEKKCGFISIKYRE